MNATGNHLGIVQNIASLFVLQFTKRPIWRYLGASFFDSSENSIKRDESRIELLECKTENDIKINFNLR